MKRAQPQDEFIRKRMERQKKIRKRRLIISFIITLILLLAVGLTLSLTVFFKIENIKASGSAVYSEAQIIKASGITGENNLFTLNTKAIELNLKKKLPFVESIKLKRKLPNELTLIVSDAEEFVCYSYEDRFFTVSQSGWVLSESDTNLNNLPEIKGAEIICKVGSAAIFKKEEEKLLLNSLLTYLSNEDLKINYIDFTDNAALTVGVEDRFDVNLGTTNFLEEKVKHLGGMIKNIPTEEKGKINLNMWAEGNPQGTFIKEK